MTAITAPQTLKTTRRRRGKRKRAAKGRFLAAAVCVAAFLGAVWSCALWTREAPPPKGAGMAENARFSARKEEKKLLDVPFIDQREEFPTGCESVCAAMALQYAGVDMDPGTFIDRFLPTGQAPYYDETGTRRGCDPRKAFPGDPRSESGWGCYAPVIAKALEQAAGGGFQVKELENMPLESLCEEYVDQGVPVLLWVTIDMAPPVRDETWLLEGTGEAFTWIYPMHCALLTGYDGDSYYFNDPLAGKNTAYPKTAVETAYAGMGSQAVVLLPAED